MFLVVTLALRSPAFALNPSVQVSQYAHTAWTIRDGAFQGTIRAITQTPDGYLWFGSESGLLRFDGSRFVEWSPPEGQALPSTDIWTVLAGRDGALWIGTSKGLARWKGGRLTQYPELAGHIIQSLFQDREQTVWASGSAVPSGVLCAIRGDSVRCDGGSGTFGYGFFGTYEDRAGSLWMGAIDRLWKWRPEPATSIPMPGDAVQGFAEEPDGTLLVATRNGIQALAGGADRTVPIAGFGSSVRSRILLRDRDGALWGGDSDGIVHIRDGRTDRYTQADGLSSDEIERFFEDREGNIWVATLNGLDRFRDLTVWTFAQKEGLPHSVWSIVQGTDGRVMLGTGRGIVRADGTILSDLLRTPVVGPMIEDDRGRLWFYGGAREFGHVENGRFVAVKNIHARGPRAAAQDTRGNMWLADQFDGLLKVSHDGAVEQIPWARLGHAAFATAMIADRVNGGLWLGFWDGGIAYVDEGSVRRAYQPGRDVAAGRVSSLASDADGTLWITTERGLTRLSRGTAVTLSSREGLPCDTVHGVIDDDAGSLWLNTRCGLVRIERRDVDAVAAGRKPAVAYTLFDTSDGMRSQGDFAAGFTPAVARAKDGRLWFVIASGVAMVDPRRISVNANPPPVHIDKIVADRTRYDPPSSSGGRLLLPALIRDLQIDYAALSYVMPEKNRYRYRLEGFDRDWQDPGNRRQAFYTNLPPRNYRFRVIGSNNSGVWNEAGAVLDFSIAPAYYQTIWFRALSVATLLALVWTAHSVRLRILERHEREISALNERLMKAQEQERIRIAGELHDGVMQQMLAVTMMLGSARRKIASHAADAEASIDKIQQKVIQTGTDIRQLSHGLHPPLLQEGGLPGALRSYCDQFSVASSMAIAFDLDDDARDLSRGAALALFRIVQEALGNAAKHAKAKHAMITLKRANGTVALTVADDGVGFDRSRLGTSGGLGLVMMRERAGQLNGTFEFDSSLGRGTTIRVVIPFR
jgi:signal transduction histidine kinase/ligand-binding sensor domain-containing protein